MTDDQISMKRYQIQSVLFSEDFGSVLVRFSEPDGAGGPIIAETKEQEIRLFEDGEMRQQIWEIVDVLCDVIDRAHADRRRAR